MKGRLRRPGRTMALPCTPTKGTSQNFPDRASSPLEPERTAPGPGARPQPVGRPGKVAPSPGPQGHSSWPSRPGWEGRGWAQGEGMRRGPPVWLTGDCCFLARLWTPQLIAPNNPKDGSRRVLPVGGEQPEPRSQSGCPPAGCSSSSNPGWQILPPKTRESCRLGLAAGWGVAGRW